jgi:uncharacterized repeat protein (TIGR02543 family)
MDKTALAAIIVAVALACVAGALVLIEIPDDSVRYEVSDELNGGEFLGDYPQSYTPGRHLDIPNPVKEKYVFQGWYLDSDFNSPFDGRTRDLTGPIVLYAQWGESLSGHSVTLTKSGSHEKGFDSYDISGTLSFTYLYYSEEKESYYLRNDDVTTYTYRNIGGGTYTETTSKSYWGSDSKGTWRCTGTETISTAAGEKDCEVWVLTYDNGAVEKQWIGDEWIPYKINYEYKYRSWFSTYYIVIDYTYVSDTIVEIPKDCNVDAYEGYGINVTGNDSPYMLGQTATLTAETEDGYTFKGWYDENMNELSTNKTYKFIVGGPTVVYALNTGSLDGTFASDVEVDLDSAFGVTEGFYTITNVDTEEKYETTSTFVFGDGGEYRITVADSEGGRGYYIVKVTGDAERVFSWKYNRVTYSVSLEIDYDDLLYARDYYAADQRCTESGHKRDATFVTLSYTDETMSPYMDELVDKLITELQKSFSRITEETLMGYLLAFTQYIEYQSDEEYMGYEEYWKFPLETLFDQGGDCEDTSILFIALAHEARSKLDMNYEVALQLLPGHMAGAIKLTSATKRYTTNPYGYVYAETTTTDFSFGEIPSTVRQYFTSESYYRSDYSALVAIA